MSSRASLLRAIGHGVSQFQEASYAFDDVAAEILAPLHAPRTVVGATLERMQLAGYARFQPGGGQRIELTEHARKGIERIWADLREDGRRLLEHYSTRTLTIIDAFLRQACEVQERRTNKLRAWLVLPSSPARRPHLRGGLSPAALRRVQLFVEANLAGPLHLHDLAVRAGLSPYHFVRAFKTSAGATPRAFVEARRVDRAKRLLRDPTKPVAAIAAEAGFGSQSR